MSCCSSAAVAITLFVSAGALGDAGTRAAAATSESPNARPTSVSTGMAPGSGTAVTTTGEILTLSFEAAALVESLLSQRMSHAQIDNVATTASALDAVICRSS